MNELTYVTAEEAIGLSGLRVAFSRGVPGPWGVGARAILEHKNIPFTAVAQEIAQPNEALLRWTGQTSAPVAVLDTERPRTLWSEIILLAERLAPQPALIPRDPAERATMFGLCHELCAEDGLGWSLRLMVFAGRKAAGAPSSPALTRKYDFGTDFAQARTRANDIIAMLGSRLAAQQANGSDFLVGDSLTAADFYWTAFSHMLRGFPEDACHMPDYYRVLSDMVRPHLDPLPEPLLAHREAILSRYMRLPMKF
jgi:glutathione S-transferase